MRARLTLYDGYLLTLRLQPEAGRARLLAGISEARACRDTSVLIGHCVLATIEGRSGRLNEAFAQLAEAERLMHIWDVPAIYYLAMITLVKCELWLMRGQTELAGDWLYRLASTYSGEQAAAAPEYNPQLPLHIEMQQAVLERLLGKVPDAERRLRSLIARAQSVGGQLMGGFAQVHLTLLLLDQGREREAQHQLFSSLESAIGGGLLPFAELLKKRPQWLREHLQARPTCPLRERLISLLPELEKPVETVETVDSGIHTEALSSRELAVLKLIAQGCSNQEISEQLFISLHTVKTHARHINSKLGVERRTQAVARAKALGVLR